MTSPYDKALVACVSKRRAMTSSTQHGPGDYVNECLTGVTASDHMAAEQRAAMAEVHDGGCRGLG